MQQVRQSLIAGVLLATPALVRAQIIDRIAVTVDHQVITHSRVLEEIRLAAFMNNAQPDFSPEARRRAAGRLVERLLIEREMELTRYPALSPAEAEPALERVKRGYASPEQYRKALAACEITEEVLRQYLLRQAVLLRFIDARFKPEVQVTETEIKECNEKRKPQTSSDEARAQCEEALVAAGVDQAVDRWLRETRARARIVYQEDAFR